MLSGTPAEVFSQVEALHALGLAAPETTELLHALNGRGFDLPLEALSVDDCAASIALALKGR